MSAKNAARRLEMYSKLVLCRAFEDKISELAAERGRLPGMQILATGQEAVAVGVVQALSPEDVVVSNHRSHAHLLARGAEPGLLMAEIMGKAAGINKGKSGTLHMAAPELNVLMTSTVVGAGPPLAAGAAFALQYAGKEALAAVFFGDGAAAEGSVHEAMNLAALWRLPVLFICENNRWAGAQGLAEHCPVESLSQRAAAYAMIGETVDGNDADRVFARARTLAEACRLGRGPALLEARTYRMRGHGEYDRQHYVPKDEIERWRALDPVEAYGRRLTEEGLLSADQDRAVRGQARARVLEAVAFAEQAPYPAPNQALEDLWA
ncbi:MAG: thiamine pyrophosphate-dependent dehydrogenase E1 component subunit alpha [Desulfovibrionaceae bacterium]|nr:thiamine pyrophosphate-dependent dehydrogenase E1 component subunit alpha [Desulfovibrionaceae bacterium]